MILVLMFSIFTIPVHGEVITLTTAAGVAVVAAALVAAGVYIASPNTRQAINDAAMDFINRNADFLSTVKVVATATGKVLSIWGSNIWNRFTSWLKNTLCAGGVTLSGYAMPIVTQWPALSPFRETGFTHAGQLTSGINDFYIGGARLTNAYQTSRSIYELRFSNGYLANNFSLGETGQLYWADVGKLSMWGFGCFVSAYISGSYITPTNNINEATRFLQKGGSIGNAFYVYNQRVSFELGTGNNAGWIMASGHRIASGFASVYHYIVACISAGILFGDYSWISGGYNVPVQPYYSPNVRIQYADNSIPGLTAEQSGLIGAIGGTLPMTANPGQDVIIPIWGTWTNGDGIPIGWAGPQGTYGTPSGTITPGTTIAGTGTGTANPPVTYPGDDVINPKLARDGVAPFPTLGDDVINPADDTFITDIDDYIDPTIDRLRTPTDVSTLTQNPTDVVGPTTDVYPESDDIPNTIRDTATDTIPDVDSPAIPDVDTATDTATPINPDASDDTSTDERNTNRLKLSTLILSKFPFCIPWDIYRTVATMVQEPEIPSFDWRFSLPSFNIDETLHIDFEQFETVAYIVRWFLSACWLVTLVLLTRKVIWK